MSRATRLAGLLRVRQLQERGARATLMRDTTRAQRATAEAEAKEAEYRSQERTVTVDAGEWRARRSYREAQAASVRSLYGTARQARQVEAASRAAWTGANQREHTMDKLVEKVTAREEAERERARQRTTDDLSGARWVAAQEITLGPDRSGSDA